MSEENKTTKTATTRPPYDEAFKRAAVAQWMSGVPAKRVAAGLGHHRARLGAVGAVGRAHPHGQERAQAVGGHVARAALDLLAPVKAALLTLGRRFDALALQDGVAGTASGTTQGHLAPADEIASV